MTELLNRLGSLGVLLIAGALILGGLAGAAVAHHYETLSGVPAASQQQGDQQGTTSGDRGDKSGTASGSNSQQGEQGDKEDTTPSKTHKAKTAPAPKKPNASASPSPKASPSPRPKASPSPSPKPSGSPEPAQVNN